MKLKTIQTLTIFFGKLKPLPLFLSTLDKFTHRIDTFPLQLLCKGLCAVTRYSNFKSLDSLISAVPSFLHVLFFVYRTLLLTEFCSFIPTAIRPDSVTIYLVYTYVFVLLFIQKTLLWIGIWSLIQMFALYISCSFVDIQFPFHF